MNEPQPSTLAPFAWVTKRDGRLAVFEGDKIARALFAATEARGKPDAFLARELTDVVLHFLAAESAETTLTTNQIAELVTKVVREVGHADVATAYAEGARLKRVVPEPAATAGWTASSPSFARDLDDWVESSDSPVALIWGAGGAALRDYSLRRVFTRNLAAAHTEGLVTLTGLEAPLELAACVLGPQAVGCGPWAVGERLIEAIEEARHAAGAFLAIDSPEYAIAHCPQTPAEYARDLRIGLRANGLPAVLNLNCAAPPVWADDLAEGPLFADYRQAPTPRHLAELADMLLDEILLRQQKAVVRFPVRIDWHLGPRDFEPDSVNRLLRVARWAVEDAPITFVFDRPRMPVSLAEGMDRDNPALLLTVGLHLPRLAEVLSPSADAEVFLQKLGSLVRLALSGAMEKREFLRARSATRPALARGFLLERARLLVAPVGLEAVVRKLYGAGMCAGGPGLEFARRVVQRLRAILQQDGPACQMEACLDGPGNLDVAAGLTPWDSSAEPESQLRTAGVLHATAGGSTASLLLSSPTPEAVASLLRSGWSKTEIVRLRFLRAVVSPRQHTATWAAEAAAV